MLFRHTGLMGDDGWAGVGLLLQDGGMGDGHARVRTYICGCGLGCEGSCAEGGRGVGCWMWTYRGGFSDDGMMTTMVTICRPFIAGRVSIPRIPHYVPCVCVCVFLRKTGRLVMVGGWAGYTTAYSLAIFSPLYSPCSSSLTIVVPPNYLPFGVKTRSLRLLGASPAIDSTACVNPALRTYVHMASASRTPFLLPPPPANL